MKSLRESKSQAKSVIETPNRKTLVKLYIYLEHSLDNYFVIIN
jgi:hypothetical protein